MLLQIEQTLADRDAYLVFSDLPRQVPSGQDMRRYLDQAGLEAAQHHARIFGELDEALEWVEDRILAEQPLERPDEALLELREIVLFRGRKEQTLAELEACMEKRSCAAGEKIFAHGDSGDELYLIRRGAVRIVLPYAEAGGRHLATFARGDFFGEMSFLDRRLRSADAIAFADCDLFVLSRRRFDAFAAQHRQLALNLLEGLASALAQRLRYADAEMQALEN
jgi:SulP family sulfate permease